MILKNNEKFTIPDKGDFSYEKLAQEFPEFIKGKRGVQLEMSLKLRRMAVSDKGKSVEQWPRQRMVSRKAVVVMDGARHTFVITEKFNQDKLGNYEVNDNGNIAIRRRQDLNPKTDKELLWFLWFCSNDITNNNNDITSPHARLSILFPEKTARQKNEHKRLAAEINNYILDPKKCTEDNLFQIVRTVLSQSTDSMSVDEFRDMISDRVVKDLDFAKEVNDVVGKKNDKTTIIREIIGELKAKKAIKVVQGKWVIPVEGEDPEVICTTSPAEDNEVRLAVFLMENEKAFARLEGIFLELTKGG